MKRLPLPFLTLTMLLSLLYSSACAQRLSYDTTTPMAYQQALNLYNIAFKGQLRLFNGKEYTDYTYRFSEGQPYYLSEDWLTATVRYDGGTYDSVQVKYNLVMDELVVRNSNGIAMIKLLKERVASFTIDGHLFIQVTADSVRTSLQKGF